MGEPWVPPLCRETSVSRTANVRTVGMNGFVAKQTKIARVYASAIYFTTNPTRSPRVEAALRHQPKYKKAMIFILKIIIDHQDHAHHWRGGMDISRNNPSLNVQEVLYRDFYGKKSFQLPNFN